MSALGPLRKVVQSPGVHHVTTTALPGTLAAALRHLGCTVRVLDTREASTKLAFLDRCARDLALPSWFGRNWDAFVDVLRDVDGTVLWRGAEALADDVRSDALEIFGERTAHDPPLTVVVIDRA